jgi:geranylgeranyl diphosphate synthase type II
MELRAESSPTSIESLELALLEAALKDALKRTLLGPDGTTPGPLAESIRYSLLSPGKRIRPRLLLACAEMLGLTRDQVLPAAIALEMVHCFTLIHDDLPCMDDDDFRRGMPSNHKKFGESTALLAGDALMALAVEVFLGSDVSAELLILGLKRLVWAMGPRGVIGGQADESLLGPESRLADLQQMHRQKTGALFSAALLIPQDFAGISNRSEKGHALFHFADELGLAFQIADDLEDAAEQHAPTSVLYYLSSSEAQIMTIGNLGRATEQLKMQWGERAAKLSEIATEVVRKTERAVR